MPARVSQDRIRTQATDALPSPTFSAERLAHLSEMEATHFWFTGRRALIEGLLEKHAAAGREPVLDLGCGNGAMVARLGYRGYRVAGLDLLAEGLHATRHSLPDAWLVQAEASRLPLKSGAFGAVLLLDILEHVDDRGVLAEVSRVLQPGGVAVIAVPMMPWLWSYRDEAAGHRRRYTRQRILDLLETTRLRVEETRYYQCLLLPSLVATRLLGRRWPRLRDFEDRPSSLLNTFLGWITMAEVVLGRVIRWPWGSSLITVARRV